MPELHPALAALEPLVGEWEMELSIDGKALSRGRTTFERSSRC